MIIAVTPVRMHLNVVVAVGALKNKAYVMGHDS